MPEKYKPEQVQTPDWNNGLMRYVSTDIYRYDVDNKPIEDLINAVYWLNQEGSAKKCYVSDTDPANEDDTKIPPPAVWIQTKTSPDSRDVFIRVEKAGEINKYEWKLFKERVNVGIWMKGCAWVEADIPAVLSEGKWYYDFGNPSTPLELKLKFGKSGDLVEKTIVFEDTIRGVWSGLVWIDDICEKINEVIDNDNDLDPNGSDTSGWVRGGCSYIIKKDVNDNDEYKPFLVIFSKLPTLRSMETGLPVVPAVSVVKQGSTAFNIFFSRDGDITILGSDNPAEDKDIFLVNFYNRNLTESRNQELNRGLFQYRLKADGTNEFGEFVNLLLEILPKHGNTHGLNDRDPLPVPSNADIVSKIEVGATQSIGGSSYYLPADHQHGIDKVGSPEWTGTSLYSETPQDGAWTAEQLYDLKQYIDNKTTGGLGGGNSSEIQMIRAGVEPDVGGHLEGNQKLPYVDHQHGVATGENTSIIRIGDSQAEGTSPKLAREDHRHAVNVYSGGTYGKPGNISIGGTPSQGTADTFVRSDHSHIIDPQALVQALVSMGFYKVYIGVYNFTINQYNFTGTPQQFPLPSGWTHIEGIFLQKNITQVTATQELTLQPGYISPQYVDAEVTEVNVTGGNWYFKMRLRSRGMLCSGFIKYLIIGY